VVAVDACRLPRWLVSETVPILTPDNREFLTGPLLEQPHRVGSPLRRELEGLHSARRGTFRILYRIDDQGGVVTVVGVEHRSEVYRPR